MRSRRAVGRVLKTAGVHANTVSYLNCAERMENRTVAALQGWVMLGGSRLGRMSDDLGISRDLEHEDDFAAVSCRETGV